MSMSNISQSHHIFTSEFYKNYGDKLEKIFGKDGLIGKDDYSNRIRLFADKDMAAAVKQTLADNPDALKNMDVGAVSHLGGHPNYSGAIEQRLSKIIKGYENGQIKSVEHAKNLILDVHQTATEMIKAGHPPLNGNGSDQWVAELEKNLTPSEKLDPNDSHADKTAIEKVEKYAKHFDHNQYDDPKLVLDADGNMTYDANGNPIYEGGKDNKSYSKEFLRKMFGADLLGEADSNRDFYNQKTYDHFNKLQEQLDKIIVDNNYKRGNVDHMREAFQKLDYSTVKKVIDNSTYDKANALGHIEINDPEGRLSHSDTAPMVKDRAAKMILDAPDNYSPDSVSDAANRQVTRATEHLDEATGNKAKADSLNHLKTLADRETNVNIDKDGLHQASNAATQAADKGLNSAQRNFDSALEAKNQADSHLQTNGHTPKPLNYNPHTYISAGTTAAIQSKNVLQKIVDSGAVLSDTLNKGVKDMGSAAKSLTRDALLDAGVLVPDGKGGTTINPDIAEGKPGSFLKNALLAGKANIAASVVEFMDASFDAIVTGVETGNWSGLYHAATEYGASAVTSGVVFGLAARGGVALTVMLGIPVIGQLAMAGLALWGAYETGKAVGSLLYKGWNYFFGDDEEPDVDDAEKTTSPLIIDLNGDGVKTTSLTDSGVHFDFNNNHFAVKTAWANRHDGILVLDKDGNGTIDSGRELFGNNTELADGSLAADGFEALSQYDSNNDNQINAKDEVFDELRVWKDIDGDGKVDEGELFTLDELGITTISLDDNIVNERDSNGNVISHRSTVTWADGKTSDIEDVWFQEDTTQTHYVGDTTVSEAAAALPTVRGFGNVANLDVAMSQDAALLQMVKDYVAADVEARTQLLDDLIYCWTGSDGIAPNSRDPSKIYGHVMDARQLVSLENLTGKPYLGTWCWGERDPNPHGRAAPKLIAEYRKFADYVAATIADQADFNGLLSNMGIRYNEDSESLEYSWEQFDQTIQNLYQQGDYASIKQLVKITADYGNYNSTYRAASEKHLTDLASASDAGLAALLTNAYLLGTEQTDILIGSDKDNVLEGLAGSDNLMGRGGDDSYQFAAGHGADIIYDSSGTDKINYTDATILPSTIRLSRDLTSVTLTRHDDNGQATDDSIKINNFYDFDGKLAEGVIESIHFADGTVWDSDYLVEQLLPKPTNQDDFLYLDAEDNTINGLAGNDTVFAGDGADVVRGGKGHDKIFGDNGADVLRGDSGNDSLRGGNGNDQLVGGSGEDLLMGEYGDDSLKGGSGNDRLDGGSGNDVLRGGNGADTLIGGSGDDKLFGGNGNDTFIISKGNGKDIVYAGNDDFNNDNKIVFTDISSSEVTYTDDGKGNLIISGYHGDDQVTVKGFFTGGNDTIETLVFTDKTLDYDAVFAQPIAQQGTQKADYLQAELDNAVLKGLGGDDHLVGSNGNNLLIGGKGNDYLEGNGGINTYQFSKGDGHDTVVEYNEQNGSKIALTDVLATDVSFGKDGDDLILFGYGENNNSGKRGADSITIKDFYSTTPAISEFHFSDNSTVTATDIINENFSITIL